jgi:hypothetical protein
MNKKGGKWMFKGTFRTMKQARKIWKECELEKCGKSFMGEAAIWIYSSI